MSLLVTMPSIFPLLSTTGSLRISFCCIVCIASLNELFGFIVVRGGTRYVGYGAYQQMTMRRASMTYHITIVVHDSASLDFINSHCTIYCTVWETNSVMFLYSLEKQEVQFL